MPCWTGALGTDTSGSLEGVIACPSVIVVRPSSAGPKRSFEMNLGGIASALYYLPHS